MLQCSTLHDLKWYFLLVRLYFNVTLNNKKRVIKFVKCKVKETICWATSRRSARGLENLCCLEIFESFSLYFSLYLINALWSNNEMMFKVILDQQCPLFIVIIFVHNYQRLVRTLLQTLLQSFSSALVSIMLMANWIVLSHCLEVDFIVANFWVLVL